MPDCSFPLTILLGDLPTALRLGLMRLFQDQPDLLVLGVASGAGEFLTQARRLRPSLLIVGQRQLRDLEQLRRTTSIPVLLYCDEKPLPGMLREVAQWGVFDYFSPSQGEPSWAAAVLCKVRQISLLSVRPKAAVVPSHAGVPGISRGVVIIGGSTGGTSAAEQVVRGLPATLGCAVMVAVHLPAAFLNSFVERLRRATSLPVLAADNGVLLEPGRIVVAPGGRNLVVSAAKNSPWQAWQTEFTAEPSLSGDQPSLDLLMCSAARTVGRNVLGVVLTGLGRDGTLGAQAIRQCGGTVLAQDEATSAVFSMPKSVIQAGWTNAVLPLPELSAAIARHAASFQRNPAEAGFSQSISSRALQL